MMKKLIFLFFMCNSVYLFAHTNTSLVKTTSYGFMTGLFHPILGLDHFLAMFSVGVVSAQIGGLAVWTIPSTFVFFMTIFGILGLTGFQIPLIELGIIISVILLGIQIALDKKTRFFITALGVGLFASFHGNAHGLEIPQFASSLYFTLGFVLGTILIHLLGVLIGHIGTRGPFSRKILRYSGGVITSIGFVLLGKFLLF